MIYGHYREWSLPRMDVTEKLFKTQLFNFQNGRLPRIAKIKNGHYRMDVTENVSLRVFRVLNPDDTDNREFNFGHYRASKTPTKISLFLGAGCFPIIPYAIPFSMLF